MSDEMKCCAQCGTRLKPDAPSGLCLRCLLSFGLKDVSPGSNERSDAAPPVTMAGAVADEFDRYRIIEKLGEGGCGVVYRAEQLVPVRREVALKVIKLGMDTATVIARFEAERQALAMMDHPGIAKVFDAGSSRQGRPFFAMELVSGERITDFCDQRQLPIAQRLELFARVCEAVQHAHQKGIIHRDLKPSNILVTEQDGVAQPKVIDFGIAKATSRQRLADQTIYTAFDQFIGTPAYMSPEQAGATGEDVDTRSDIYSLGVLLYELLTGRPPFEPERLRQAAVDEIFRIIRDEDPARPSARLTTMSAPELSEISRCRFAAPPKLLRELRGDLDWVVMKALEKLPARRYETANALAVEVRRHLHHEPVLARPPTAAYRFQKMVRRNKLAFAAATAVLAALVAGLAMTSWMFLKEREARQRAVSAERTQERLRNEAEAQAYGSDLNLAARSLSENGSLGGVVNLLSAWRGRTTDRRGWEWFYLNGTCHRETMTIRPGSNSLRSVAWTPDGRRLAVASDDGDVTIWDATTGRELARVRAHARGATAVAWNSDGTRLASGGEDAIIRIWDAASFNSVSTLRGHRDMVLCLAWSRDGEWLASGSQDGSVRIWDLASGSVIRSLAKKGQVKAVTWSPDGRRLAAGGADVKVHVWDSQTGLELLVLAKKERLLGYISAVAWSPDGQWLASGGSDSKVRIYQAATGEESLVFTGHPGSVAALAWSPDEKRLATTGRDDGTVTIWDAFKGEAKSAFRGHSSGVRSLAWQPGGEHVASASLDGTLKVWDLNSTDASLKVLEQEDQIMSVAWHPDGTRLATASKDASVRVWTPSEGRSRLLGKHSQWAWRVAWNPAGTILASSAGDGEVKLWDMISSSEITNVVTVSGQIRGLAWNPDGRSLAAAGWGDQLSILDPTGRILRSIKLRCASVIALAYSPDGRFIAAGGGEEILIVDATSGQELKAIPRPGDAVRSLSWSPDGSRLAAAADDGLANIWDVRTGQELHKLSGHSGAVYAIAWSPDGSRLATGSWDNTLRIWHPDNGRLLCTLMGSSSQITCLAWSSDGHQLACGDLTGHIVIRDRRRGYEVETAEPKTVR